MSFDTVGDKENGRIISWIEEFSLAAGFETEKVTNGDDGRMALIAHGGKPGANGLVFMGHTDTVPAGEGWKTDPFTLTQVGKNLFGLGSADMKGGIAAMLAVMCKTDPERLGKGLEFIFTFDEERCFGGIREVVKRHDIAADCIVIGEPTEMEPVVATKGTVAFKVDFTGKEAHSSSPEGGVNAIEMAMDFIASVKKFYRGLKRERSDIFASPTATLNIAKISGGDAINKVPSACSLGFEFRVIDNAQKEKIRKAIRAVIKENGAKAKIEEIFSLPVTKCRKGEFVAAIEKITGKESVGVSYATEGAFLPEGSNAVILGPGSIKVAHRADEYVSKSSLDKAVRIYGELIEKYCA